MNPAFAVRRQRVMDLIAPGAMVLFAAPVVIRNNDVEHEYRQDSDFYYLMGFDEPESAVVISTGENRRCTLFLRERDADRETWDGPRLGVDTAATTLGIDDAYPIEELAAKLPELIVGCDELYHTLGKHAAADELIMTVLRKMRSTARKGGTWPTSIVEPGKVLHEMRLHKDDGEIAALVRAIDITEQAHRAVLRAARPNIWEFELEARLLAEFRGMGAQRVAYSPIVASGVNATVLHHRRNDRQSMHGELILVDAACEFDYQSADITRTFPVDGRFSTLQRQAYDVVLSAQRQAIDAIMPGVTLDEVHDLAVRVLSEGLLSLGILGGDVKSVIDSGSYKKYYMHRTSHWLGMDVHDVGRYHVSSKPRPLQPGMVLTVEPGLYFPVNDAAVPKGLQGCGIRIEDDILVTDDGHRNLSQGIPKAPDEIEAIMQHDPEMIA
jgi:Xaa-Pro aminopeptidase